MRRVLALVLVVGLLASAAPAAAAVRPASRQRLATVLFDSNATGTFEIWSVREDGARLRQLTHDARWDSFWPKASPDGRTVVFYRTPAGVHDTDYRLASLWRMDADGGDVRQLLPVGAYGWQVQGHAEWSPDGTQLVMSAGHAWNLQIWITDADGSRPRQVTARGGTNIDPSWTPDGRALLFTGCPQAVCYEHQYEVYRVAADGRGEQRLTADAFRDHDPYTSPDGKTVAWLRAHADGWAILTMRADGRDQAVAVGDPGAVNSKPEWTADGRVLFHRLSPGRSVFALHVLDLRTGRHHELPLGRLAAAVNEYPEVVPAT